MTARITTEIRPIAPIAIPINSRNPVTISELVAKTVLSETGPPPAIAPYRANRAKFAPHSPKDKRRTKVQIVAALARPDFPSHGIFIAIRSVLRCDISCGDKYVGVEVDLCG